MAQSARPAETAATHARAPVLLAHVHLQRRYTADAIEYVSPNEDVPGRQADIPKLRRGGVKYIWLSEGAPGEFAVDPELSRRAATAPNLRPAVRTAFHGGSEVQRLLRGWDVVQRLCAAYSDHLGFARSVREARAMVARGLVAVFWHTESLLLANDLAALRAYHALGLRTSGLVHAAPLDWIDLVGRPGVGALVLVPEPLPLGGAVPLAAPRPGQQPGARRAGRAVGRSRASRSVVVRLT